MCSFVREVSPKGLEPPKKLGTSLQPGTAFPLEMSTCGGLRVSERNSPLSVEVGFTHEGKDDLGERRVFMGTKSPPELGLRVGLGKDFPGRESLLVSNKHDERMASPQTKSPLSKGLEMRFKRQTISRNPVERSNLGVNMVSSSQETKPCLGMLPGRVGLENECLPAGCSPGRIMRPPLGMVYESPQALGSRRSPVAGAPEVLGASVGKQPVLGVELRQELEKESTGVVMKPSAEMQPPVEVDIGLPQPEEPDEMKSVEPKMGLVIDPECEFARQPEEEKEAENIEPGLEPPDRIRPIYSGKFFDRMPCWPSVSFFLVLSLGATVCIAISLHR